MAALADSLGFPLGVHWCSRTYKSNENMKSNYDGGFPSSGPSDAYVNLLLKQIEKWCLQLLCGWIGDESRYIDRAGYGKVGEVADGCCGVWVRYKSV